MKHSLLILLTFLTLFCDGAYTKVTRVIDGDTFEIETGEKVRLIGINAPEITDIFGQEAKVHLSQILEGQTIDLVADKISNDRDRYNRLLRYVIFNGIDINKKMLLDGYAFAYLKYHFEKESEYKIAQLDGNKNKNGIWGDINKENVKKQPQVKMTNISSKFNFKNYFTFVSVLILIIFGIYYYNKNDANK